MTNKSYLVHIKTLLIVLFLICSYASSAQNKHYSYKEDGNHNTVTVEKYKDENGTNWGHIRQYLNNIDSLIPKKGVLDNFVPDRDSLERYSILYKSGGRMVLVSTVDIGFNAYYRHHMTHATFVKKLKIKGVAIINGAKVFVHNKIPNKFFTKVKKVNAVAFEAIVNFDIQEEIFFGRNRPVTVPPITIVGIVDL